MTRERAEKLITKHLRAIERIMERFDPEDVKLSMAIREEFIWANNEFWNKDSEKSIDVTVRRFDDSDF